jgi:VWFA-related protein
MPTSTLPYLRAAARWLPVGAIAAALGVVAVVQAQQPAEQQSPSTQAETAEQTPVFRSAVTLVTTDVIVRDSNGQFLPDLDTDDLKVFEDGVEQEIASLVLVHGGRVYNQLLPPAPVQEGIILPPTRPVNDTAGRIFILFVDDMHLQTSLTPKVRQVFKEIADTLVHEGDLFGIVSTGPSSLAIDMTYDRTLLYSAMEKIIGDGFSPQELIEQISDGGRGPEELRWRAHKAFKLATEIVDNMAEVENRRKAFIYISSGYDFNPFEMSRLRVSPLGDALRQSAEGLDPDAVGSYYNDIPEQAIRAATRLERQGAVFADSDLALELAELTQAANRANASFYTIDPRGLVAGADLDYDVDTREFNDYLFQTQNTLRMLAELTGGKAVVNRNDFDDALREIDAETSDYYVLGYYTNNPDPTYRTRRLRVEVERPGVEVRHRSHYTFARPGELDSSQ